MNKYIIISLILLSVVVSGCKKEEVKQENKPPAVENQPPANTNLPLDSTDYTVISSAISQFLYPPAEFMGRADFFAPPGSTPNLNAKVIISDSTKFSAPPQSVTDKHKRLDPTDTNLTQWLISVNQNGYNIDSTRMFSELILSIKSDEFMRKNKSDLKKIYEAFPNGVVYLSKPAYSDNKMRAVVYFKVSGKASKKEGLIWLRSEKPVWSVYDIVKY